MVAQEAGTVESGAGGNRSATKDEGRFQDFAGPHALITNSGLSTSEEAIPLWVVPIVQVETAGLIFLCLVAKEFFVPGPIVSRWNHPEILVIGLNLQADLDTLVAYVAGMALKEASDLSLAKIAE